MKESNSPLMSSTSKVTVNVTLILRFGSLKSVVSKKNCKKKTFLFLLITVKTFLFLQFVFVFLLEFYCL